MKSATLFQSGEIASEAAFNEFRQVEQLQSKIDEVNEKSPSPEAQKEGTQIIPVVSRESAADLSPRRNFLFADKSTSPVADSRRPPYLPRRKTSP